MKAESEKERLDKVASDSWYHRPVNEHMIRYCAGIFLRHIRGGRVLELGPAEGVMTPYLMSSGARLTVVEGSEVFCRQLRERFPEVEVVHSLFEEYSPAQPFDTIVMGHVLEHVADASALLRKVAGWLAPSGRVLAAVPNSRSIHRQAAVIMRLLPFEESMSEADRHHGHRRVFNPETFRGLFFENGFAIEIFGDSGLSPCLTSR